MKNWGKEFAKKANVKFLKSNDRKYKFLFEKKKVTYIQGGCNIKKFIIY